LQNHIVCEMSDSSTLDDIDFDGDQFQVHEVDDKEQYVSRMATMSADKHVDKPEETMTKSVSSSLGCRLEIPEGKICGLRKPDTTELKKHKK
jgi:hypothetical protein